MTFLPKICNKYKGNVIQLNIILLLQTHDMEIPSFKTE